MENGASAGAVFISFAKLHCYKFESVWPMKNDVNQEIRAQTGRNSLQNLRGKQQIFIVTVERSFHKAVE